MTRIFNLTKRIYLITTLRKCLLIALFFIVADSFLQSALAKKNDEKDRQSLTGSVATLFAEDPARPKTKFPPSKESLLGAIVTFDQTGEISVISRLKPDSFEPHITQRQEREISDEILVVPNSKILSECIDQGELSQMPVLIGIKATNIELVTIDPDKVTFHKPIQKILHAFMSIKDGRKIYLVSK